jgi:hypothetical protein
MFRHCPRKEYQRIGCAFESDLQEADIISNDRSVPEDRSRIVKTLSALTIAALFVLAGCDSVTNSASEVRIGFATSAVPASAAKTFATSLDVIGPNGTLRLEDIRVIVAEFELKGDDDLCEHQDIHESDAPVESDSEESHEDCAEFETPPFFLDLPLDQETVTVSTANVDPGTYSRIEFEIEDLEDDDEDAVPSTVLLNDIRTDFPDWPREASMMVTGSFEDADGNSTPFTVYVEAEIEIEIELSEPLTITGEGGDSSVTVTVDPTRWFSSPSGDVRDLSQYDFGTTGNVLDLELEFEHGFDGAEVESD